MSAATFPKSDLVDIMLFSEGTYPYVRGGVSSWILQLMKGLPQYNFGVCFIGAKEIMDGEKLQISYEFPPNLVHLEVHYLFEDESNPPPKRRKGNKEGFEAIEAMYKGFKDKSFTLPKILEDISFYETKVTFEDFLYSKRAWDFIDKMYTKNAPDVPFVDYFWTLRNIHRPIWILANIVKNLPETKIFHSPSTGYAGLSATLASLHTNKPFLLTEHGIYTRERKIDMFSADWIEFKQQELLQQPEEYNYIKQMWINFFDKIGVFCYHRANHILSLFAGARKVQISYGADARKTAVIPNGVDVDTLNATMRYRQDPPKPIITLIGRVVPIKDIKTFIRAIKIASLHNPEIEGWIVGPVEEDFEYFTECQEMALSLGLKEKKQIFKDNKPDISHEELEKNSDTIKFFGHSDIKKILPKSALQSLSSISEGMPLVILEGFAAGVPCVATDVGSCKDLIEGGIDATDIALGSAGAVTEIANPEALAQEYVKFLDFENGLWEKAQQIALQRVQKYYRQEMFLQSYAYLYDEALGKTWDEATQNSFPFYIFAKPPYIQIPLKRFPIISFSVMEEF